MLRQRQARGGFGILPLVALTALLVVAFIAPAQDKTANATASAASQQVTRINAQPVASWTDCAVAAADISFGLQNKGLRVVATLDTIKRNLAYLVGLIPGVNCGKYLGAWNVKQICYWTQRPAWLPFAAYSRGFVWVTTGGQTNQCTP